MFHSFLNSLARSSHLSLFLHSFKFTLWFAGTAKFAILQGLFFFVDYYDNWSGRDLEICLYFKIREEFMGIFLQDRFWVVHIAFVPMVKLQLLAQFQLDPLSHPVVPILYSFCANLLLSFIMWLKMLLLSPHNLHMLFYCVFSILDLIWSVFISVFVLLLGLGIFYILRQCTIQLWGSIKYDFLLLIQG